LRQLSAIVTGATETCLLLPARVLRWDWQMAPIAAKLLQEALSLPEDARVDLAAALLQSVEHEPADEGADGAWSAEANCRLEEVRSGAVKPVRWEEAERQIFDPSDDPKGR
jgi:putative addiction module component (TIGR02574 family)